jgi:nicotinamidase-related amidase
MVRQSAALASGPSGNRQSKERMQNSPSRIDPSDSVLLFVDLQTGIFELSRTVPIDRLAKGVSGLAKLAKIFQIPAIVSGVSAPDGAAPSMIPQLADGIGAYSVLQRTTADSLRNEAIVAAVKATARHTLLISGVSTEVAVQLPALTAADMGFRVFLVTDACGGMSERTEQAAIYRIIKAGGTMVSVMGLAGELAGDFRSTEAQAAIGILYEMATA